MINFLNRTQLFIDSDPKALANVYSTLKKNRIEYEVKTLSDHSTFGRNLHYRQSMSIGGGGLGGTPFGDEMHYSYVVYVKKSDLERAKKLCSL